MEETLQRCPLNNSQVPFSAEDFLHLPQQMQAYLTHCRYFGKGRIYNFLIDFEHTGIKLKPDAKWTSMKCQQFNSVLPPTRLALMQSRMYGFIPFTGRDKLQNGHGNMLIKLAGITVSNATGTKMDQAALVTYLAETPLLPAAYLLHNITWNEISENIIKATVTDAGNTASGEFYFNDQHEINAFRTNDRFYSSDGKEYKNWAWSAYYDRYEERNGIKIPTVVRAVWHMPEGDYEYFRAATKSIRYNIRP
ncbi:DUF6544 domain-containing protein [Pontibacter korlensis]